MKITTSQALEYVNPQTIVRTVESLVDSHITESTVQDVALLHAVEISSMVSDDIRYRVGRYLHLANTADNGDDE